VTLPCAPPRGRGQHPGGCQIALQQQDRLLVAGVDQRLGFAGGSGCDVTRCSLDGGISLSARRMS
jgi:hypothetical protein